MDLYVYEPLATDEIRIVKLLFGAFADDIYIKLRHNC